MDQHNFIEGTMAIKRKIKQKSSNTIVKVKEDNLAYGGQALIEGVLMRGQSGYAFTVKKPDDNFFKEKKAYISLGKRIKILGFPFIRGVVGFFENMVIGIKVLNKSGEIAFPEEEGEKVSNVAMFFLFAFTMIIAMVIFVGIPYFLTALFRLDQNKDVFAYNLVAGIIRLIMFFGYLALISLIKDTKRLFGYHGAEHKTINAYEQKKELTVKNVQSASRLHPRCGTSFLFIVFLITLFVFPFFNIFFNTQVWYNDLMNLGKIGDILQKLVHIASHILVGMPIVAAISYEILKLSGKFQRNPIVRVFIAPGLFFQLFTTREPDNGMIKAAILSLKMVLGEEKPETARSAKDESRSKSKIAAVMLLMPLFMLGL
jgi:uncharacterized protein YqhQ